MRPILLFYQNDRLPQGTRQDTEVRPQEGGLDSLIQPFQKIDRFKTDVAPDNSDIPLNPQKIYN